MAFWYSMVKSILKVYTTLFIEDISVSGMENVPEGPKIIVANHPNATDSFLLPFIFPEQLHFLIQASVFETPIVGRLLAYAGQIPVIAGKSRQALGLAREKLIQSGSVVIYPEGRLNNDEGLRPGKIGAALLAAQTEAPILPLGFYVPPEALRVFKRNIEKRTSSSRWQFGGSCFIRVGKPLQIPHTKKTGEHSDALQEFTELIMESIGKLVILAKQDAREAEHGFLNR